MTNEFKKCEYYDSKQAKCTHKDNKNENHSNCTTRDCPLTGEEHVKQTK